jgi:hypothetical protein
VKLWTCSAWQSGSTGSFENVWRGITADAGGRRTRNAGRRRTGEMSAQGQTPMSGATPVIVCRGAGGGHDLLKSGHSGRCFSRALNRDTTARDCRSLISLALAGTASALAATSTRRRWPNRGEKYQGPWRVAVRPPLISGLVLEARKTRSGLSYPLCVPKQSSAPTRVRVHL